MPDKRKEADGIALLAGGVLAIVAVLAWWKAEQAVPAPPPAQQAASASVAGSEAPGTEETATAAQGASRSKSIQLAQESEAEPAESVPPCYEGINLPPGWKAVDRCFSSPDTARDIVRQLREVNLHATAEKTAEDRYAVRYQPITKVEAETAGNSALAIRRPQDQGIYQLEVLPKGLVDSYAWKITMPCPTGWHDAGSFKLTAYVLAQERDFPASPTVDDPCGLEGTYAHKFLFGEGVRMQGSGITNEGQVIHFKGKNCFEHLDCARTAIGRCAKTGRTIAVDPKVISLGSEVLVEDIGYRIAEDTGGAIRGSHIDVYYGIALRLRQAWAHTREDRKVCVKPREMAF